MMINPYRKPTQVDEERILRRVDELQLRNSANSGRTLARRPATAGEVTCSRKLVVAAVKRG